jgi:hypothetical protein
MNDDSDAWLLAIGHEEAMDIGLGPPETSPLISCPQCGTANSLAMSPTQTTLQCSCGAVLVEIVARL